MMTNFAAPDAFSAASPPRLLLLALTFPGCHRRAGVERVVWEAAHFLAARGHEVNVFANEFEPLETAPHQTAPHFHHVPMQRRPGFLAGRSFFEACTQMMRDTSFDVVGTHGCVCPLGGVYWVHSLQRAWLEHSKMARPPLSLSRLKQRLNPLHPILLNLEEKHLGQRNYQHLLAMTPQVRDDLARFYNVPASDVTLIPNGFAPSEFNLQKRHAVREEMRHKLGYAPQHRVVIFVANELERKGFAPLLRALASLQRDDTHLLAVGRLDAGAYAAEIEQLGLKSRVQFSGPSSDVSSFYAASDVFALPTQYEAWGLVIVEAMACGLPVLTSRLAGAAVAVREGHSGALLDNPLDVEEIAAKLSSLLDGQHASAQEISDSVEAYAWPRVLLDYEALLARFAR